MVEEVGLGFNTWVRSVDIDNGPNSATNYHPGAIDLYDILCFLDYCDWPFEGKSRMLPVLYVIRLIVVLDLYKSLILDSYSNHDHWGHYRDWESIVSFLFFLEINYNCHFTPSGTNSSDHGVNGTDTERLLLVMGYRTPHSVCDWRHDLEYNYGVWEHVVTGNFYGCLYWDLSCVIVKSYKTHDEVTGINSFKIYGVQEVGCNDTFYIGFSDVTIGPYKDFCYHLVVTS